MEIFVNGKCVIIDDDDFCKLKNLTIGVTSHGYVRVTIDKKRPYLHRLVTKAKAEDLVDHINGNRLDNRKSNLRLVSKNQNAQNCSRYINNKSGVKGVYLCKQTGRWRAEIRANNKVFKLGRFETLEEAKKAYDEASKIHHGQYARRTDCE